MLRTLTSLLMISVFSTFLLTSCSNDSNDLQPAGGDSSWLVSTVKRVGLEIDNGVEADTAWESYTYLPGKIIHKAVYTDGYAPLQYDSIQFSYYYDAQGKLLKYENDYVSDLNAFVYEVDKLTVNYSGDKISSLSREDFYGNSSVHQFAYSADMRQLTIYDTLNSDPSAQDQKYQYYFNADQTIDSTLFINKYTGGGGTIVFDTVYGKYNYSSPGNLNRYTERYRSPMSQDFSVFFLDVQQRETRGSEIGKTLRKIRSTLDFYHVMHLESNDALSFFDMSLPANVIFYPNPPITLSDASNLYPTISGTVINIFDSRNLLVEQTFPSAFGSKREGPSKLTYTYVRVPN